MPPVHRLGDVCTGHGCYGSRPTCAGSPNVMTNGIPTIRVGDPYNAHCCGPVCHDSTLAAGSGSVMVNGIPCGRIGDAVACGGSASNGSGNVIAGG